jgi:arylformamidase
MTQHSRAYDISVTLGEEDIPFPGDPPFSREILSSIEKSGVCNVSKLGMCAHSGTHIDMPAHFIAGGNTLDAYIISDFIRRAHVVGVPDAKAVKASDLEKTNIRPGDAVLFKTDNSTSGRCRSGVFSNDFVYISLEAAEACARKKVGLVGLDYITIEEHGNDDFPAHRTLLGNGILVLETINLQEVPPGKYTLTCLPLKIKGGEASPVRAILTSE